MTGRISATLDNLHRQAQTVSRRAYVPYSGRQEAAVLLLSDGTRVPGVRVENASFSLTIPPLVNAFSTAVASRRTDVVAGALSRNLLPEDVAFVQMLPGGPFRQEGSDGFVWADASRLPKSGALLHPFLEESVPTDPEAGIRLARRVAERAHVPESAFPVGAVLITEDGQLIPGSTWSLPTGRTSCVQSAMHWERRSPGI